MKSMKFISPFSLLMCVFSIPANGSWVAVNGPYADYVKSVLVNQAGCLFASTDGGGFASFDTCITWVTLPVGGVDEFMMMKADGSLLASKNGTIFHSDSTGKTWSVAGTPKITISQAVSVITTAGEVLVAAGKEIDTTWTGNSIQYLYKFYYSADGALTWHDVAIQPQKVPDAPDLRVCTYGGYVFMKDPSGVYRTGDPAGNCQLLNAPVPPDSITSLDAGGNALYCGGKGRIFYSTTLGNGWNGVVFSDTSLIVYSVHEVCADTLVIGTNDGVYRMVNGKPSLLQTDLSTIPVFNVQSASSGVLFAASGKGLFRSRDNGVTWFQAGISVREQAQCLAVGQNDTLYVGTSRGVYRSGDNGNTWSFIMRGLPNSCYHNCVAASTSVTDIAVDPIGRVFMVTEDGFCYRLDPIKMQWLELFTESTITRSAIIFDSKADVFLGTGNGVWVSRDSGDHFVVDGFTGKRIGFIMADGNDRIFVSAESTTSTPQPALYRSADTGATWQQMNSPVELLDIPSVGTIGPDNTVYIIASRGTMIVSKDHGVNFSIVQFSDSSNQIISMGVDESGVLYFGTYYDGLYSSSDHGATWVPSWTPKVTGHAYEMIGNSRHELFLGTWPDGLLKYTGPSAVVQFGNSPGHHGNNAPHSFGGDCVIFDILGRKIGNFNPSITGVHHRLPAGTYLLQTGAKMSKMAGEGR